MPASHRAGASFKRFVGEELRGSGVRATLIEPSATSTELWDAVDGAGYDLPPREAMLRAAVGPDASSCATASASTR